MKTKKNENTNQSLKLLDLQLSNNHRSAGVCVYGESFEVR